VGTSIFDNEKVLVFYKPKKEKVVLLMSTMHEKMELNEVTKKGMYFARRKFLVRKYVFPEECDTLITETMIIHLWIAIFLSKLTNDYSNTV